MSPLDFEFEARIWRYEGDGGSAAGSWYFVSLPRDVSARIRDAANAAKKAGGSVRVTARIGRTRWKTSIFPDRKGGVYALPLKAAVRAAEQLRVEDQVGVTVMMEGEW